MRAECGDSACVKHQSKNERRAEDILYDAEEWIGTDPRHNPGAPQSPHGTPAVDTPLLVHLPLDWTGSGRVGEGGGGREGQQGPEWGGAW